MKDTIEHSDYFYDWDRNGRKSSIFGAASETDYLDFWNEDGISLTGNPYAAPDTIVLGSGLPGGSQIDRITFGASSPVPNKDSIDLNLDSTTTNGFWKYSEDIILKEVRGYLSDTYRAHYCSQESKTQTLDLIDSIGDAEAFCRSNAIKYLSRFGKKDGKSKFDILKAIHYCILLYHFSGIVRNDSTPYETLR